MDADRVVSSESEQIILVDSNDNEIGFESKAVCHDGAAKLHRALSVFLFDKEHRLILQQRAPGKRLWPGIWSNSCCSHPRRGEDVAVAAVRRVQDELNTAVSLERLFSFEYQARWKDLGSEHELCHVFIGRLEGDVEANKSEISATKLLGPAELEAEFVRAPAEYSPWLQLEWPRIRSDHWDRVEALWK